MALSMEEQRILAEIEHELARSEPVLAARLSAFGRPSRSAHRRARSAQRRGAGAGKKLQRPWVLAVASVIALVLLTVVPVAVYALVSLRVGAKGQPAGHTTVSAQHHATPAHQAAHQRMSLPR